MEQKAQGELERQKLQNEKESEEARRVLLELQAVAAAVESSGQSKAEAQAHAEKLLIEGQSAIERMWGVGPEIKEGYIKTLGEGREVSALEGKGCVQGRGSVQH